MAIIMMPLIPQWRYKNHPQIIGEGAFFDLTYSCIDGDITEDDYWRSMHDFKFASEAFPFLNRITDLAYSNDREVA